MNTIRNIYDKIVSIENCKDAVYEESQTTRASHVRDGSTGQTWREWMRENKLALAEETRRRLMNPGDLKMEPLVEFPTFEAGKWRDVACPSRSDAIVIRAVQRVVEPLIYGRLIESSYCPIPMRGSLKFAKDIRRAICKAEHQAEVWNKYHPKAKHKRHAIILQCDIRHFFPSIRIGDALVALGRTIADQRVLALYAAFLTGYGKVPIGSGFSAMVANHILSGIDRTIAGMKEVDKYFRYMDDMIVLASSKAKARKIRETIETELNKLGMSMQRKWTIYRPYRRPVNVGGYRVRLCGIFPGQRVARHLNKLFRCPQDKRSKSARLALRSLYGYIKNSNSRHFREEWSKQNAKVVFAG